MSKKYPGGIITKSPATPTGPLQTGTAPGVWTIDQATYWIKQGLWPIAGNFLAVEDVFSTWLYTGNSSTQTITNGLNLSGQGGMVWIKSRSTSGNNIIEDSGQGFGVKYLITNSTAAAAGDGNIVISSTSSTGFTLGNSGANSSGTTYASWTFREAANFFDVVTYTGTGSARTIAHNLGIAPGMMIIKKTSNADAWYVWHRSLASNSYYMQLQSTGAADPGGATLFNNTAPTASVFSVGTDPGTNGNGETYVAYLFAHDTSSTGLIQCGSVTATTGQATVTLGWEPQWVLVKQSNTAGQNWIVNDVMRNMSVTSASDLQPSSSNAEQSPGQSIAPTATGFTLNASYFGAGTYIYIAIRRGPMRTPTLGTSVFAPVASSAAVTTQITTGFPVDLHLAAYRPGDSYNFNFTDRLRGMMQTTSQPTQKIIISSSTGAEQAGSTSVGYEFWNTGWRIGGYYNTASTIYYDFRRAPSFFDEVCYTGTGVATTQAHNLGVVPELMIVKKRNGSTYWAVYASSLGATKRLVLNDVFGESTDSTYWNNTSPTASVFTVGTIDYTNASGGTYVAYLFASCPGVSKVGSYTGTGALQTINCGFTTGARFVLIKRTDSTGDWYVWDSARGISSGNDPYLLLNSTAAEVTGTNYVDTTSVGFQVTAAAPAGINANGGTYIFLAVA